MEGSSMEHISPETPENNGQQQQPRSLEEEWKGLEAQKRELAAQQHDLDEQARLIDAATRDLLSTCHVVRGVIREVNASQRKLLLMMKIFIVFLLFVLVQQIKFLSNFGGMVCNCTCTMPNKTVTVEPQQVNSNYTYEDPVEDPLTNHWMRY